jgi:histidine triad (HIT) family protein
MECLFCKIVDGTLPADRVADGDGWIAFRDVSPQAPTHVLVVPSEHIESISALGEADSALGGVLLRAAADVARQEGLGAGYRVVANTGADGGQTVPHLHLHVLGGRALHWPPG